MTKDSWWINSHFCFIPLPELELKPMLRFKKKILTVLVELRGVYYILQIAFGPLLKRYHMVAYKLLICIGIGIHIMCPI